MNLLQLQCERRTPIQYQSALLKKDDTDEKTSSGTERRLKQLSERLLAGGWVLDAVTQLGLVAFAARQGDVGKQMQHFAGRRRRGAGGLQSVAPL